MSLFKNEGKEDKTGTFRGLVPVGEWKCALMYKTGKLRPVETILRRRKEG
jgi:hypothetical protein